MEELYIQLAAQCTQTVAQTFVSAHSTVVPFVVLDGRTLPEVDLREPLKQTVNRTQKSATEWLLFSVVQPAV